MLGLDKRQVLLGGVVVVVLAALAYFIFRTQPIPVDLGAATRGEMIVSVGDEGQTRIQDIYTVSAPVDGRLLRVDSEVGDTVSAYSSVLVAIEPRSPQFLDVRTRSQAEAAVKAAEAALTLAQADVGRAAAELDYARAELERAEALARRGNVSASALDRARLEMKTKEATLATAEAALRVKEFELETARASLIDPGSQVPQRTPENCCVPIYSPVDGQVLRILRESEGVVSAGTPIIEIGDPHELEIVVDLLSRDAVRISPGDAALIDDWGGPTPLNGRVRRIEPFGFTKVSALGIEEQRVNVIVDLTDPPETWTRLGHGYRVDVRIVIWRGADALRVPQSALFRSGDAWAVFVVEEGVAARRRIEIGHVNPDFGEVLGGLQEDDFVVLHPGEGLEDGAEVVERSIF